MAQNRPVPVPRLRRVPADNPFGALVRAAGNDADATTGLAAAYSGLPAAQRRKMIQAVVADATEETISPLPALWTLLSVEHEPELARALFDALSHAARVEHAPEPSHVAEGRCSVSGDEDAGSVLVVRSLYGELVELVAARWNDGGFSVLDVEPLMDGDAAARRVEAVERGGESEPSPVEAGLALLAGALWRHLRRTGELPDGATRLLGYL